MSDRPWLRKVKLVAAFVRDLALKLALAALLLIGNMLVDVSVGWALGALMDNALDWVRVSHPNLAIVGVTVAFIITIWKEVK